MAAPTIYGQRYGVPEGSPWGPGKSGLTPLSPLNPLMAPITLDRMLSVEDYQSFLLNGLTTQLLRDLDCITERDLKPNDLKNPNFKTWQKHHWDTEENFKDQHTFELYDMSLEVLRLIGQEGQTVKWVAGHPKVWEALEPCLRLGTRILDGLCDHPWFDAVLLAKRENISPQRFSSEARKAAYEKTNPGANIIDVLQTKYKCFNLRTLEERGDGSECRRKFKQVIDEVFNSSYGKLSIGFMSDQIDPLEGRNLNSDPSIPGSTLGLTAVIPTIRDIKVWLAYQEVAPLLRNDLSSSERLMDTWNVAVNMVHETIHAFNKANWLLGPRYQGDEHENRMRESYFGVEQEIELGRSGEQAIYGGIVEGLIKGEKRSETAPHLGFSIGIFPEPTNFHGIAGNPRLINPNASAIGLALPLPVTYYENINSEEYWEIYVKKFSINGALKTPKLVDGVYQKRDPETGVFEWLAITEKDVGVRQTIDKLSILSLISLAPAQRDEHAIAMKRYSIAVFQPMIQQRDDLVREVIISADDILQEALSQDDPKYWASLGGLFDDIKKLLDYHTEICAHLARVEMVPGTKVVDTRNKIHTFHRRFRTFIESYMLNQNDLAQRAFEDIRNVLNLLEAASLSTPPTAVPGSPISEGVQATLNTLLAYLQGDQEQCQALCVQASSILGCPPHVRTAAGFLLAKLDKQLNVFERVASLRSASQSYSSLNLGDVPQLQALLQQLQKESNGLLTILEREERMNGGRNICR